MILALFTLFSGLAISSVAIYYSVLGLAAIFAASALPIMIMGTILEISKLVAAWWLKWNWKRAPIFLRSYMLCAVLVLMFITSMGIFGYLSKAHVEQGVPTGDIAVKVEIIDQQIKTEQSVIKSARDDLALLNAQLTKYTELGYVTKGVNVRKGQEEERAYIAQEIKKSQETISQLRRDRAPLSSQLRRAAADVGPIKYIAQLIYGDNPGATVLEKAVVWVIIIIVFVFDPLAVLLLLSAQLSFGWWKIERDKGQKRRAKDEFGLPIVENIPPMPPVAPLKEEIHEEAKESSIEEVAEDAASEVSATSNDQVEVEDILEDDDEEHEEITVDEAIELFVNPVDTDKEPPHTAATHPYLTASFQESAKDFDFKPMVYKPFEAAIEGEKGEAIKEEIDTDILANIADEAKEEAIISVFDQLAGMSEEELVAALDETPDTPLGAAIAEALAELEKSAEPEKNQLTNESNDTILEEHKQIVAEENDYEEDIPNDVVYTNTNTIDSEGKDPNSSLDQKVDVDQKDIIYNKIQNSISDHGEPDQKNEYIDNIIDEEQEVKKKQEKVKWIERVAGEQVKRTID